MFSMEYNLLEQVEIIILYQTLFNIDFHHIHII